MTTVTWADLSTEDQDWLKEHYPKIAMDLIFGLPSTFPWGEINKP